MPDLLRLPNLPYSKTDSVADLDAPRKRKPRKPVLPTFSEYDGGGALLSPTTLPETVISCCETADLLHQVREMFRAGREVII